MLFQVCHNTRIDVRYGPCPFPAWKIKTCFDWLSILFLGKRKLLNCIVMRDIVCCNACILGVLAPHPQVWRDTHIACSIRYAYRAMQYGPVQTHEAGKNRRFAVSNPIRDACCVAVIGNNKPYTFWSILVSSKNLKTRVPRLNLFRGSTFTLKDTTTTHTQPLAKQKQCIDGHT